MTDLCTNNEWNGKRREEDRGDDDVNGALRPSSLQNQPAKWVTHSLQTSTGPRQKYLWGGAAFCCSVTQTNPEEGAQRQPHLYILHFLQPEMWDLRLLGFAGRRQMAEELGEQQSLRRAEQTRACSQMEAQHSSSLKRRPAGGSDSPRWLLIVPLNCH